MALEGEFLLLGRILFGVLFLYNGYNHFANNEAVTGYAEFKGVPAASLMVVVSGVMMILGSLGVILGAFPVLSAGAIAVFLLVTSPKMHDFWNASDEDRQNEFNHFLKNVSLLGAALVLLASASEPWAYAVNVGLF